MIYNDQAILDFDNILQLSGFAIDYNITDDNFNATNKPIAYRNISRIDAATKPLYLMWNVIAPETQVADDKVFSLGVNISLSFYANNPWLYNQNDQNQNTKAYKDLLEHLESAGWTIEMSSEYSEVANEGSSTYAHRKDFIISKQYL